MACPEGDSLKGRHQLDGHISTKRTWEPPMLPNWRQTGFLFDQTKDLCLVDSFLGFQLFQGFVSVHLGLPEMLLKGHHFCKQPTDRSALQKVTTFRCVGWNCEGKGTKD